MPFVEVDGRTIETQEGDSIASALWRAGIRVFSRSFKYRRPRGLYCLTGDCPNCLVTVDGEPAVRACCTPARDGQRISREVGWPSAEHDIFSVFWLMRRLLPVGFYYKTFLKPRGLWPVMDGIIRKLAGLGRVPRAGSAGHRHSVYHHPGLFVAGGGVAGLAGALAAADSGQSVVLAEEHGFGEKVAPGAVRSRIESLRQAVEAKPNVTVLERAAAIGVYEGALVVVDAPDALHQIRPARIVVATGAVERHAVFAGGDLIGVWLGRGAARLAGAHRVSVGGAVVFAGETDESLGHLRPLLEQGTTVKAALLPQRLAASAPEGVPIISGGTVVAARGRKQVRSVIVESPAGRQAIACDAVVLSLGLEQRN